MDLFSDFDDQKWDNKGEPPQKLTKLDGYKTCNMLRNATEVKDSQKIFTYYMTTDAGIPVTGILYGAARDPLKSIGHCGMKITEKNNVSLVTGCIVEGDWVEMKQEYLDSLDVHGPEKKEEKPARLSLIIGLASDLQGDKWNKKEDPPKNKSKLGYHYVNVIHCEAMGNGAFDYSVSDDDGAIKHVTLNGADRDPLRQVGNCYLKFAKEGSKEVIKGIIVADDWVEMV